jgi:hypothetical protein
MLRFIYLPVISLLFAKLLFAVDEPPTLENFKGLVVNFEKYPESLGINIQQFVNDAIGIKDMVPTLNKGAFRLGSPSKTLDLAAEKVKAHADALADLLKELNALTGKASLSQEEKATLRAKLMPIDVDDPAGKPKDIRVKINETIKLLNDEFFLVSDRQALKTGLLTILNKLLAIQKFAAGAALKRF